MNSLSLLKLDKSRMNFMVEKFCNVDKNTKLAIHKNNSIYSIDKNEKKYSKLFLIQTKYLLDQKKLWMY